MKPVARAAILGLVCLGAVGAAQRACDERSEEVRRWVLTLQA
jgi:hypothetical protein